MVWLYQNKELEKVPEKALGFVYKITRIKDGKFYIGQKKFYAPKYVQKDKKRKKILSESDWRNYWSSSNELQTEVKEKGEDLFRREILVICKAKGEMNYLEMKYQLEADVLRNDNSYNHFVGGKIHRKHLKTKL